MPIGAPKVGTVLNQASGTTAAVAWPAGLAANDYAVLFVTSFSTTTLPTLPATWTQIARLGRSANTVAPSILVAGKFLTGSESGTQSVTVPNVATRAAIFAQSGVDLVNPLDVTATTYDSGATVTGTTLPLPTLTTTMVGVRLLAFGSTNSATHSFTPPTSPATFTEIVDGMATKSGSVAYLDWASSGATGTVTMNMSGAGGRVGVLAALRPAADESTPRNIRISNPAVVRATTW